MCWCGQSPPGRAGGGADRGEPRVGLLPMDMVTEWDLPPARSGTPRLQALSPAGDVRCGLDRKKERSGDDADGSEANQGFPT